MQSKILEIIARHEQLVSLFKDKQAGSVADCVDIIVDSLKAGGKVLLCGNGGSASDCQHVAGELVGRFLLNRKGMAAIALTTDSSILTSVSNDYGFEDIFARQVEGLGNGGDVLWAFSTSGTSPNVLKAVELAKEMGLKVIGFTGKADSKLEKLSDACVCSNCGPASAAQEIHVLAYHIICELVEQRMAG